MENTLEEIILFVCLVRFHSILPEFVDGFGSVIPKLRENTFFYMSIFYMQTFVNLKQAGSSSCNMENTILEITVFPFVWQPSTEHCIKMSMDLDWPYQDLGNTLYFFQISSWKHI